MIIFKSGSDATYTERQYFKFGKTKGLNEWSTSTWEYCSFFRDLKTCKHLFALTNFCLTCSLNLQLLCRVTSSKDKLLHCGILQICSYCVLSYFFRTTSSLHFLGLQIMLSSLDQFENTSSKRSDRSELLFNGAMIVELSVYLKRAGKSL